jgi:hypothetical protein
MALTRWNPFDETFFFGNEMDPVYEDNLARVLNEPCEEQEKELEYPIEITERGIVLVKLSLVEA